MRFLSILNWAGFESGLCHSPHYESGKMPGLDEAFQSLKDGNNRFAEDRCRHIHRDAVRRRQTVEKGQHPFATIFTCSDSRVPAEILFDQGIGDLFIIRVAGNICATDEIASIEYGVAHLETPVLVVLGHSDCGAVAAAALDTAASGAIAELLSCIRPAVERVLRKHPGLRGAALVEKAVVENVWQAIHNLLEASEPVQRRVAEGRLRIEAACYDLESGEIEWLGSPDV